MANKILTNSVLIPIGIPICLENILAMIVLFRCRRMIPQIKMLTINLSITDFCTGLMLCLPDDIVNSCTYKKYLAGPFVVVSLLTITMISVDRCCALIFTLRYYAIVTKRFLICTCVSFWMFFHSDIRHVSRQWIGIWYLLRNFIPDSERANQHHFKADNSNHPALQHLTIYLPI